MTPSPKALSTSSSAALSVAALLASLAPAAVLMFLGQPAAAQAAPRAAEVRIDVNAKGPDTIRHDVASAARRVCAAVTINSPLLPREQSDCRRQVEAEAMRQISPPPSLLAARD